MKKSKKKDYTDETKFVFFKENLVANRFELTLKEIKEKYLAYLTTKEDSWITYYGDQTVIAFISSKDGLSSVSDACNDDTLSIILSDLRHTLPCYQKTKV